MRSLELQKALVLSVGRKEQISRSTDLGDDKAIRDHVRRQAEDTLFSPAIKFDSIDKEVERRIASARESLRLRKEIIHRVNFLLKALENLPEGEFAMRYQELLKLLDTLENHEERKELKYTLSFVDIYSVKSLEQFIKGRWPMQFIPHKAEIGRMLSVAKQVHATRIEKGSISASDPICIVDVGGSNGTLGRLLVDLGRENGMNVHVITVDPDKDVIAQAQAFHQNDEALTFVPEPIDTYVARRYQDMPEIKNLLDSRKQLIEEGERKTKELEAYLEKIYADISLSDPQKLEKIKIHCRVLKEDFGISLDENMFNSYSDFLNIFETKSEYDDPDSEDAEIIDGPTYIQKYRQQFNHEVECVTQEIYGLVVKLPPMFDLVVNSWMPPGVDLTPDILCLNGGAICYALERNGATGCQSNLAFSEKSDRIGGGESYETNKSYVSRFSWHSHSAPQLRRMSDLRSPDIPFTVRLLEETGNTGRDCTEEKVFPFSNNFIVQLRSGIDLQSIEPHETGVSINGAYPWEQELDARGGSIQPISRMSSGK